MKKNLTKVLTHFAALAFVLFSAIAINGQSPTTAQSLLPFDHTDKAYADHGILASMIENRRNGADGASVFDIAPTKRHRGVRITATHPAYGPNGGIIYWNNFGELGREAFTADRAGVSAAATASQTPVYIFPSQSLIGMRRQAAIIPAIDAAASNPLGLGTLIYVMYTDQPLSDEASAYLADLGLRNGHSLDGTPIIKTVIELSELTRRGIVRQFEAREIDPARRPFIMAKVIAEPENGGIAPDAFLTYIIQPDGTTLPDEQIFLRSFECLRRAGGNACWSN